MSAGSLPKCCGFITLSALVISAECMSNANKSPKIAYSAIVMEVKNDAESVSGTDHDQQLISSSAMLSSSSSSSLFLLLLRSTKSHSRVCRQWNMSATTYDNDSQDQCYVEKTAWQHSASISLPS